MINHIDLSSVLRRTVCDLYSDLVTRPTGAAVRNGIEQQLAGMDEPTLTVIDFSHVGLLDFSCADEIVAKLLLRYTAALDATDERGAPRDAYFVFRGLADSHLDAIEAVLERHGLAIVAQLDDGSATLVGMVDDNERRAWEVLCRLGRCAAADLSREAGIDERASEALLETLSRRRLVMPFDESYVAVGAAT